MTIKNPIHLRMEKLKPWQSTLFILLLCERMAINYRLYCEQNDWEGENTFQSILDLGWEQLIVKKASINFDNQLTKLEAIIPEVTENSSYLVFPAIDACEALAEFLHAQLNHHDILHAIRVSQISLQTIADIEAEKRGERLSETELKEDPAIIEELDIQWELFRLIQEQETADPEMIKALRQEIRALNVSNIGLFLTNQ